MVINITRKSHVIWEWPKGNMNWFFWGWRPEVFNRQSAGYRIGPLTLWRND